MDKLMQAYEQKGSHFFSSEEELRVQRVKSYEEAKLIVSQANPTYSYDVHLHDSVFQSTWYTLPQ